MSIVGYDENETQGDLELKTEWDIFSDVILLWMDIGNYLLDLGRFVEFRDAFMQSGNLNLANVNALIFVNEVLGKLNDISVGLHHSFNMI